MGVFQPYSMRCNCGRALEFQAADSVNVQRFSEARAQIIR